MRRLSTLTWVLIASFIAMAMVACGKSSSSRNEVPAPPVTALTIPAGVQFGFFAQKTLFIGIIPFIKEM